MNALKKVLLLAFAFPFLAHSQNLPSKQSLALAIPVDSKIDGTTTEWHDQFQAYNKGMELFYTIANDDKNIYLAIQATNPRVVQKLVRGGVSFLLSATGKKDDYNGIIYPLMANEITHHALVDVAVMPDVFSEPQAKTLAKDTLLGMANKLIQENMKEIKVIGMPAVTDTIVGVLTEKRGHFVRLPLFYQPGKYIPVNNVYGIRTAMQFKASGIITGELIIPLKLLGITNDTKKLNYKIVVNGLMDNSGHIAPGVVVTERRVNGAIVDPDADLNSPTDFEGEYTLKK